MLSRTVITIIVFIWQPKKLRYREVKSFAQAVKPLWLSQDLNPCSHHCQKQGSSKVGKGAVKTRNHRAHERRSQNMALGGSGLSTSLLIVLDLGVVGRRGPGWSTARSNEGLLFRTPWRGGKAS